MCKRLMTLALAGMLLNLLYAVPAAASAKQDKEAKRAEKVKQFIAKLGTGPEARVALKLRDQTQLKGYVSQTRADDFDLVDAHTGTSRTLSYAQVEKVKLMPALESLLKHEMTPARIFKRVAIGFGLFLTAVMVVCLASQRCQE